MTLIGVLEIHGRLDPNYFARYLHLSFIAYIVIANMNPQTAWAMFDCITIIIHIPVFHTESYGKVGRGHHALEVGK